MEISNYKTGDELKILSLFNLVFKKPMSLDYWLWRFHNNPAGSHAIKLMWDKEVLVGHYAVSPVKLTIDSKEFDSALSMTTMTHPDYGGRGIFGLLANSLYEDLKKQGAVAVWGFPNNNSHYGFIKNLGWQDVGQITHITLQAGKYKSILSDAIQKVDKFDESHEMILQGLVTKKKVAVNRSLRYLTWRYCQNPSSKYDIFNISIEGTKGFVVAKQYPSSDIQGVNNIFITEIGLNDKALIHLKVIISHLLAYYNQKDATINTWLNIFDNRYLMFEKTGFYPSGKSTYLGFRPLSDQGIALSNLSDWHFSYGDSDVY